MISCDDAIASVLSMDSIPPVVEDSLTFFLDIGGQAELSHSMSPSEKAREQQLHFLDREFESHLPLFQFNPSGQLRVGYEWGVPSDLNSRRQGDGQYFASGNITQEIAGLPIKLSGQFFQFASRPQTQNFFRIEFDAAALKQQQQERINSKRALLDDRRKALSQQLSEFDQQEALLNSMELPHVRDAYINNAQFPSFPEKPLGLNSLTTDIPSALLLPSISSDQLTPAVPNMTLPNQWMKDSLQRVVFLQEERERIRAARATIQDSLHILDEYDTALDSLERTPDVRSAKPAFDKWLSSIQKFQLGQVNPSFSTFLVAGLPVNGVYFRSSNEKRDVDFVHGQLIADQWMPNDRRARWLQEITQDIIPVRGNIGDRITSGMVSLWKQGTNQLNVGMLYGIDKWIDPTENTTSSPLFRQSRNGVIELNGKIQLTKHQQLEIAYAHSGTQSSLEPENSATTQKVTRISNGAAHGKWSFQLPKRQLEIFAKGRLVSVGFRSLGQPFLREDQSRAETGIKKQWDKKASLSLSYRSQRTNVSETQPVSTALQFLQFRGEARPSKNTSVMGLFAPLRLISRRLETGEISRSEGYQYLATTLYRRQKRNLFQVYTLTLSEVRFTSDTTRSFTRDLSSQWTGLFRSGWGWQMNSAYYQSSMPDSIWSGKQVIVQPAITFTSPEKQHQVLAGGNLVISEANKAKWGWQIKGTIYVRKKVLIELLAERVVIENIFSEELVLNEKYPYRCIVNILFLMP